MSIQVAALWPLPAVRPRCLVNCQRRPTADRDGMTVGSGSCWMGQPSVLWTDRHVAVISL